MIVKIRPSRVFGCVSPPSSKSVAHRALISSFLSNMPCELIGDLNVWDIEVTKNCLDILKQGGNSIDVCESGSTLRFLLPVVCALSRAVEFNSCERLANRPIGGLLTVLNEHGATFSSQKLPLITGGKLKSGVFKVDGTVSSQYITGLMLALPLLNGDSVLEIMGGCVSADYLKITKRILSDFGITVNEHERGYFITGNQKFISPKQYFIEGDWSSAAFFLALGAMCGELTVNGVLQNSTQGDKIIVDLLKKMGAELDIINKSVNVKKSDLYAIEFDAENYPDIVPVLCAMLATANGISRIYNVERLKLKESDRLYETLRLLNAFQVNAKYIDGAIVIEGGVVKGCNYNSPNDHRLAMAAAVLACVAQGESVIAGAQCVKKSYPAFFEHLKQVKGEIDVSV